MEVSDEASLSCRAYRLDSTLRSRLSETGDFARGERTFGACITCHSLELNRNMTGPSLAEVWNRKSGSLASFPRYSPALKSAGIVWKARQ
jgi:cytochrome c